MRKINFEAARSILSQGCWGFMEEDEEYAPTHYFCGDEVVALIDVAGPPQTIGVCRRHLIIDWSDHIVTPLRDLLEEAWEDGNTSEFSYSANPWT